jgi:AraC family transcriptional regulator
MRILQWKWQTANSKPSKENKFLMVISTYMEVRIENLSEKKLIGIRMRMSFSDNKTGDLWRRFMPCRKEIKNSKGTELYSIQSYPPSFFDKFNPDAVFEKWAAMEVKDFNAVPDEMETLLLPEGAYAVFLYKGAASDGAPAFQYIIGTWLPDSEYELDNRPHFEILGEKYRNNDPGSEEEIWIPIRFKIKPDNNCVNKM